MTEKKPEIVITNRVFAQAAKRLRKIAATRSDADTKRAWLHAADVLAAAAKKSGGAK